jgi:hypothetical protein
MRIAWWVLGAVLAAGCGSGGAEDPCPADLPSSCPADAAGYKATIAPMLAELCVPCHSQGGPSVHLLQTYAEVSALRGSVLDQVYACKMPPAGSGYPALTTTQRLALLGWLVCGAPDD